MINHPLTVAALYRFASFADPAALRAPMLELCKAQGIKGTILLATEGVNGTIAGGESAIASIVAHIRTLPGCADLDVKYSHATEMPFYRMKVMVKKEIVTLGLHGIDPVNRAGTYVTPDDWNALITASDTVVIDTRNDYEVGIGTFKGAINPKTESFGDFPAWFRDHRAEFEGKKVAMFCTGGIRCEKSTAFLRNEGIDAVYHLQGGILRYLEEVPAPESLWEGECFVFDQRVSVGHGLTLGSYDRCHACRDPLSAADKASPFFTEGLSCPNCHDKRDDAQRARYAERQKQIALAKRRGQKHVGSDPRGNG
ncbi:MAG: rhodanese-related sulfurtransferase [Chakrabartia sp.]